MTYMCSISFCILQFSQCIIVYGGYLSFEAPSFFQLTECSEFESGYCSCSIYRYNHVLKVS